MEMIRVSVAMVTYNGETFLKEQIDSILQNLTAEDELVISDDGSTDTTVDLLQQYAVTDNRVKIVQGPHLGVIKNVEYALQHCRGTYIFLADQDDVWRGDKVEKVLAVLGQHNCNLVNHNAKIVEADGKTVFEESYFEHLGSKPGVMKNIWKNSYVGCCMAFTNTLKDKILPIPDTIEMHDQWIGIINDICGGHTAFLEDKLINYRRHSDNASSLHHYGIYKMIRKRVILIIKLIRFIIQSHFSA